MLLEEKSVNPAWQHQVKGTPVSEWFGSFEVAHEVSISHNQGDQIGRIFAFGPFLRYFGQFFEKYRSGPNFRATFFPQKKIRINSDKKSVGLHFRRFFRKLIWSLCSKLRECTFRQSGFISLQTDDLQSFLEQFRLLTT
jgi:hypothetical protein